MHSHIYAPDMQRWRSIVCCHPHHNPRRLSPSAYNGSGPHRQWLIIINGSSHRCQHTQRSSPSACNGPGRSFLLHGRVVTSLPYIRYRDMPLMAHISATNVTSILQGTQPNGCSHLTRVVMLPFHKICRLPALVYISDLNVTPFMRYIGYPRWYTSLTFKVT